MNHSALTSPMAPEPLPQLLINTEPKPGGQGSKVKPAEAQENTGGLEKRLKVKRCTSVHMCERRDFK